MSFLAPLFLAGIAAVSLPILFHLIRRTPRGRVLFSSLMFLSSSPPRVTKRSRLEHWPLLLLRALAVLLLALAFARPFLWAESTANAEKTGVARNIVIVIDVSASMQRESLWDQAKAIVSNLIDDAAATDRVAVLAFDRSVRIMFSFDQWVATPTDERGTLAKDAMRTLKPGWGSTDVGQALAAAADLLLERNGKVEGSSDASRLGPKQIVLISDLQKGTNLAALQAYEWPSEVIVQIKPLRIETAANAGIELLAAAEVEDDDKETQQRAVRVRVVNEASADEEKYKLAFPWFEKSNSDAELIDAYVPAGESRVIRAPEKLADWNGNRIELRGDDVAFDNVAWRVPRQPRRTVVLYLADDEATDAKAPLYYLQRAFPSTIRRVVSVDSVKADSPLTADELNRANLLVVASPLSDARIEAVRQSAESGKTVLVSTRAINMSGTLGKLVKSETLDLVEAEVADYAMLANIDFTHRYFAPFADPRFGDFTKVRFWHHRSLRDDELLKRKDVHVIARFDNDSPAIIDVPLGKGRCVILATGWHPEDGQLALSSKFVPLMNIMLDEAMGVPRQTEAFHVGDDVDLAWLARAGKASTDITVTKPDGTKVPLAESARFSDTDQPGIYTVAIEPEPWRFAVNLDPRESQTSPLDESELESRGVRLDSSTAASNQAVAERERQLRIRELENRHKIWRGLIVAALAVLLFETWLAGRYTAASLREPSESSPATAAGSSEESS